jgi:anti-sigma B factor antagonist
MLDIEIRDVGGITVLDLSGSLVLGREPQSLSHRIKQLVADQRLSLLLNAQAVSVIDSSGVGDLVASFTLVKKAGGSLKVSGPSPFVRDVLRIARIPTMIEVFDTEEAALKSFTP